MLVTFFNYEKSLSKRREMPAFPSRYVGSVVLQKVPRVFVYPEQSTAICFFCCCFFCFLLQPGLPLSPHLPQGYFYSCSSIQMSPLFPKSLFCFFFFLVEQSNLSLFFNVLLPETPRDSTKRHSNLQPICKKERTSLASLC